MDTFVGTLKELQDKGKLRVSYKNRTLLLVMIDHDIYAIQDKCPHQGASLYPGKLEGETIYCKQHNLGINITNGHIVNSNHADYLKLEEYERYVNTYKIIEKDGKLFVRK